MYSSDRQEVTGLVCNKKVNISNERIQKIRKYILYLAGKGEIFPIELSKLVGQIEFVKAISKTKGKNLLEFAARVLKIDILTHLTPK